MTRTDSSGERECVCEGEFIWACGSECRCFHHTDERERLIFRLAAAIDKTKFVNGDMEDVGVIADVLLASPTDDTEGLRAPLRERLDEALHEWWNDEHDGKGNHACRPVPSEDEFLAATARHGITVALSPTDDTEGLDVALDVDLLRSALQQTRLGHDWREFRKGYVSRWPEQVAARYVALSERTPMSDSHLQTDTVQDSIRPERTPERTWPSRDDFDQMTPAEVNAFLAAIGVETRVVEP